jgi:hypothetical protein
MSRGTAVRGAAGIVCLALALLAVLLARDVWHVQSALRSADARAQVAPVGPDAWAADTRVPFDTARRLLGVRDDLAFRALVAQARASTERPVNDEEVRRRLPLKLELLREENDPDRARAAEAAGLLGLLYSTDPNDRAAAERTLKEFVNAVRLDPGNETAKRNLELLLRQGGQDPLRGRKGASSGEEPGHAGAGLRQGGRGY